MIRIGMINTGAHGYLYGSCFGPYDRYAFLTGGGQLDIVESSSVPVIPFKNTRIVSIWDSERAKAEQFARAFGCAVADDVMAAGENTDAIFLADTGGSGEDHADVAIPFMEKGLPLCVDKPFADGSANARKMVEVAERTGTPVFSASLLRYAKATEELKALDVGDVKTVMASAGGSTAKMVSAIHGFATLHGFMGSGIVSANSIGPEKGGEVIRFLYKDGRLGILQMNGIRAEFRIDVFGSKGIAWRETTVPEYRYGAIKVAEAFAKMAETKEPALPYDLMLEAVAAIEAARRSTEERREVVLEDVSK